MHRAAAVAVVLLVVVQPAAALGDAANAAPGVERTGDASDTAEAVDSQTSPTIAVDTVLSLTPDRPGSVSVVQTFDTPEEVTELSVTLDQRSTVTASEGFSHVEGQVWEWDGRTDDPELRYELSVNRTTDRAGPLGAEGSYIYADVGEWALIQQPNVGLQWSYRGAESISVDRSARVDGEGAVGETTAFLGPHEEHTRQVAGQEITLIVPDDAELADPPGRILDGLGNASRELQVGDRDETVFAVAAPTNRVNWAVQGVQVGDTDFWVQANQPVDAVGSVWLHEYVHTRQSFRANRSGQWFTEASATWYAVLLSHQHEGASFAALADYLERGSLRPQSGSVLADPADWANNANYWKGALVSGELDRRLRLATDGGATLQRVFASLNDRTSPITNADILAAVESAGSESTRDAAERLTTTSAVPDVWGREAHREAFAGDTAMLRVQFDPTTDVRATGPYRNATVGEPVRLAAGETLSVRTGVENRGDAAGEYTVTLRVDDEAVATENGTLDPDEHTTATLSHRFDEPGSYVVAVAGERVAVEVREPATPAVSTVTVDRRTVEPGDEVRVTATVTNGDPVPGRTEVAFTRDGETVATRSVTVGPGESETVTATVDLPASGTYRVGADSRTVEVRAVTPTETTSPGFGAPVAIVALLAALGLRRRRSGG